MYTLILIAATVAFVVVMERRNVTDRIQRIAWRRRTRGWRRRTSNPRRDKET